MQKQITSPKSKQAYFRLTQADRDLIDKLARERGISKTDVFSKALNHFTSAGERLTIHDHFDGANFCVQCKGTCRLKADDRALTALIRRVMELLTVGGWTSAPEQFEAPLVALLGFKRYQAMWKRSVKATLPARGKR